jgi:hypothetical protein
MSEEPDRSNNGPFIGSELRPQVAPELLKSPPLETGASDEEMRRRALAESSEPGRRQLQLGEGEVPEGIWQTLVTRHPDVHWTELDDEAVLLHLENGTYYTLNRVGTLIWSQFTGDRPLEDIARGLGERFDMDASVLRRDLLDLVGRLRQEGLVVAP